MNPTPEELTRFQENYYCSDNSLDIEPNIGDRKVCYVTLREGEFDNEIDGVTFDDETTARRYIGWLVINSEQIDAIYSRQFIP